MERKKKKGTKMTNRGEEEEMGKRKGDEMTKKEEEIPWKNCNLKVPVYGRIKGEDTESEDIDVLEFQNRFS